MALNGVVDERAPGIGRAVAGHAALRASYGVVGDAPHPVVQVVGVGRRGHGQHRAGVDVHHEGRAVGGGRQLIAVCVIDGVWRSMFMSLVKRLLDGLLESEVEVGDQGVALGGRRVF